MKHLEYLLPKHNLKCVYNAMNLYDRHAFVYNTSLKKTVFSMKFTATGLNHEHEQQFFKELVALFQDFKRRQVKTPLPM